MKKLFIAIILLFFVQNSFGQKNDSMLLFKKNAVFVGAFLDVAPNLYYSINYEFSGFRLSNAYLSLRLGISHSSNDFYVPIMLNLISGRSEINHVEFGGGVLIEYIDPTVSPKYTRVFPSFFLGYRYQKPSGGLLFRCGFNPVVNPEINNLTFLVYFLRAEISLGLCF